MVFIDLDACEMINRDITHKYIAEKFGLDEYERNLGGMLETLNNIRYEALVKVKNSEVIEHNLGEYGKALIDVLNIAGEVNPRLHIRFLFTCACIY